jgi:hypothetical protein
MRRLRTRILAANEHEFSRVDTQNSLTDFSRDILLRDGAMLRFRASRPGERAALKSLMSRCSPDSIRYRFLYSIGAVATFCALAAICCEISRRVLQLGDGYPRQDDLFFNGLQIALCSGV